MNRAVALLVFMLSAGCLAVDPSEVDDAQEAVAHHLDGQASDGPWEAICLDRQHGAEQEDEATFHRRFDGHRIPVVPVRLCSAAGVESFEWVVEGTGEVAIEISLRSVRRKPDGRLLVAAGTSTGTIDHTLYDCTLMRHNDSWQVEECVVTVTT